jgi:gas vesicle protein
MNELRDLEKYAEQLARQLDSANDVVANLIAAIKQAEKLAQAVDLVDLRNSYSLKNNMNRIQQEVTTLQSNVRRLELEMSDTNSKIRRALY